MRTIALLESGRGAGDRTGAGTAASLTLHIAILGFAVLATTHSPTSPSDPEPIFVPLPQLRAAAVTLTHLAPPPMPVIRRPQVTAATAPITPAFAAPSNVPALPVASAATTTDPAAAGTEASQLPGPNDAYDASQVDQTAGALNGQRGPVYPESLQRMGVQGRVMARFIVGVNGRVDGDPTILSSSNDSFSDSVRRYLSNARYRPAMMAGRPVRQMVEQEFDFEIRR